MRITVTYKDKSEKEYDHFDIDKFENLENIIKLDCSSNQLTSLPENIGSLVNLEKLWCSENQLTSLPESIGNLVKLYDLKCDDNQLTSLPESFGNLVNLKYFDYSGNPLKEIPQIQRLKNKQNEVDPLLHSYMKNCEVEYCKSRKETK